LGDKPHCGVVPLLAPGHLPFALSLEFVCGCKHGDEEMQHEQQTARRDVVELVYVLSGSGHLEGPDGSKYPVSPGVSAITWANSTRLVADPHDHDDESAHSHASTSSSADTDMPLSILKFYLPTGMLDVEGSGHYGRGVLQPHELEALLQVAWPPSQFGGAVGVLSDAEAVKLLQAAHARTRHVMDSIQMTPVPVLSNVMGASPSPRASSPIPEDQPHHAAPPPSRLLAAAASALKLSAGGAAHAVHGLLSGAVAVASAAGGVVKGAAAAPAALSGLLPRVLKHRAMSPSHSSHSSAAHATNSSASSPTPTTALAHTSLAPAVGVSSASVALPLSSLNNSSQCVLMKRAMEEFKAFRFPKQTNQLAFVFDPSELGLSLSFGVEVFEPGHHTPRHVHTTGHELFFVLAGEGDAYCDGHTIPVSVGDVIVFPPGTLHALDNNTGSKLYTLQMMCPDDEFVAYVQSGEHVGRLNDEDICNLTANRC